MKRFLPLGFLVVAACGPSAPPVESVRLALEADNGTSLNGSSYSGLAVYGTSYTTSLSSGSTLRFPVYSPALTSSYDIVAGVGVNGTSYDGAAFDGVALASVTVTDTIEDIEALVGAGLQAELTDGSTISMAIAGVARGEGANDDVLYYNVYVEDGGSWSPLCGYASTMEAIPALAVPGTWDHRSGVKGGGEWSGSDRFTFACRGSSIAKCVEFGYKPWLDPKRKMHEDGAADPRPVVELDEPNHLQACVRMLRADYCGDGTSWTQNGRRIEFWDDLGLHTRSNAGWTVEAAWNPKGAECVRSPRVEFERRMRPSCWNKLEDEGICDDIDDDDDDDDFDFKKAMLLNAYETQLAR